MSDAYEQVTVRSRADWRAWLSEHHRATAGIWLVTYTKASGGPYLAYGDIAEEALCFGWVDSVPRKLDAERSQRSSHRASAGAAGRRPTRTASSSSPPPDEAGV